MSYATLIRQRTTAKSSITRILNWVEEHKNSESDVAPFKVRRDRIKDAFERYVTVQDAIENLTVEDDAIVDMEDRFEWEDKYLHILAQIETCIERTSESQSARCSLSNSRTGAPAPHSTNQYTGIRLPEISIPIFKGDSTEWTSFSDLFQALVVNNTSLTNVQKLFYLKSFVRDEPLKLIDSLEVTNDNFENAYAILKQRYENPTQIANSYLYALFSTPILKKCTARELRKLVTHFKGTLESFKNLKITTEQRENLILVYHLQQKLDFGTRRAFEQERDLTKLPTVNDLFEFLERRCTILQNLSSSEPQPGTKSGITLHANGIKERIASSSPLLRSPPPCACCDEAGHRIYSCKRFIALSNADRRSLVNSKRLCNNCLGSKHLVANCASTKRCSECNRKHHSLIHGDLLRQRNTQSTQGSARTGRREHRPETTQDLRHSTQSSFHNGESDRGAPNGSTNNPEAMMEQTVSTLSKGKSHNPFILLSTAMVNVYTTRGVPIVARALLDTGSQHSFITQRLVAALGLKPQAKKLNITGISQHATISHASVHITIHSRVNRGSQASVTCSILQAITSPLPQIQIDPEKLNIPRDVFEQLADPEFFLPSEIDLLIGADVYFTLMSQEFIKPQSRNKPAFVNTQLGWIVAGAVPARCLTSSVDTYSLNSHCAFNGRAETQVQEETLDSLLTRFWNMEEIPSNPPLSVENALSEEIFTSTTKVLENGSFQIDIPLKSSKEHQKLGDSFSMARNRFLSLERRFQSKPELFSEYKKFLEEYVSLGHARYVPLTKTNERGDRKYFIPHLCVTREASTSTKLRVVFDASAKSSTRYSLNDICHKGFQVQPDLYDILCRFRSFNFVLVCDIEKMYRQIRVNPQQCFLQNILWRSDPNDPLQCIELSTVTYGTNFAPYVATRVLTQIGENNRKVYPAAADSIQNQCYVDDILSGGESETELFSLYAQLNSCLNQSGFRLHKWLSNSPSVISKIHPLSSSRENSTIDLNLDESPTKVLGLNWLSTDDTFCFTSPQKPVETIITKRKILSSIAQCFDPLGLVNPVIVKGKILMQMLWSKKMDWDTEISDKHALTQWADFTRCLSRAKQLKIPRCIFLRKLARKTELHGFADASLAAYGACVYVRREYIDNSVSCNLVSAKSKVAPMKTVSLPRLELCAMLLLAKLAQNLKKIFEGKISFETVNLWSDSEIALGWCRTHASRWTVFVSNRVAQIQDKSNHAIWRHVKSAENPADLLSRGLFPETIIQSDFWFHGPKFLNKTELCLDSLDSSPSLSTLPEERKTAFLITRDLHEPSQFWHDIFLKFSSFSRLKRSVAYALRFISNSRQVRSKRLAGALSVDEIKAAQDLIIKDVQKRRFRKELFEISSKKPLSNKNLLPLAPYIDSRGFIRVGGRLANADIPFDQQHPILLPSRDPVVALMLTHEHIRLGHAGAQSVLSNVRTRFWPLNGLREVKRIIRRCIVCHRFNARTCEQIMANLPKERVNISRPFQNVGVDFGGPFFLKTSKLRKAPTTKAYIAVFVCMATKAIHIELVSSLSTEDFLMTLKRFISRRGNPSVIFSDNGTNFAGSRNELKELYQAFTKNKLQDVIQTAVSQHEIQWKFIPPRSPHWGGLWESAIKSAKYHLKRIAGRAQFTFEEFSTVLCQIEAILNSRPLCALSNNPSDLAALTPGHFLIGTNPTSYPEKDVTHINEHRLSLWQRYVQIQQVFWKRWSVDYLNRLQNRPKWAKTAKNVQVGDLVLIREDDAPPLHWPLARVIQVMPGSDGVVRVVRLRTQKK
ncbi:uncharacterized protein [Euwallacea fornicatus]|uniref:uncharacterized protein n=1 Tax=Euwallacea fornicatus TaxID=995702 RepID=UPI00338E67CD